MLANNALKRRKEKKMGLINLLFGRQQQRLVKRMQNATCFAVGAVCAKLLAEMEDNPRSNDEKTMIICAALNTIMSKPNPDLKFRRFERENEEAIAEQIEKLKGDQEARLLLTKTILVRVKTEFDPARPDEAFLPVENLKELGLYIPGVEEPSPDPYFDLVRAYCKKYMSPNQYQYICTQF